MGDQEDGIVAVSLYNVGHEKCSRQHEQGIVGGEEMKSGPLQSVYPPGI